MKDDRPGQSSAGSSIGTQVTILGGVFLLGMIFDRLLSRPIPPPPFDPGTTSGVFSLNGAKTGINFQPTGGPTAIPIEDLIADTPSGSLSFDLVFDLHSPVLPGVTTAVSPGPAPSPSPGSVADRTKFLALMSQFLVQRAKFSNKVQGSSSCCRN